MGNARAEQQRQTLTELRTKVQRGERLVMVTAYDCGGGRLADEADVDLVLVGDSAAMTVLGLDSTVPITLDELIVLAGAARRGAQRPLVICDMPFGSYEVSDAEAVRNAIRIVKETGVDMVKLEGASSTVQRVQAIVSAGVAVCGHIGLVPQSAVLLGGYRTQGRTAQRALELIDEALALEAAGASMIVLEAVPSPVAARITEALTIPTIGIGAGPSCDGQVLVYHDLLGLSEGHRPRFVKQYADVGAQTRSALARFADDVRSGAYPSSEHEYAMPQEELALFEDRLDPRASRSPT
ncbi:MAG: 3-methyl-2-oxobutanoate hydroxymethyltransferase [Actinomycetia bacterium]|nr:3-methyl-2-oxobutanoate hydroxymethyltransferase [Actinomycetes bacterium]